MKHIILGLMISTCVASYAGSYTVVSPDKQIEIRVNADKSLTWSVLRDGQVVVEPSALALQIEGAKVQPGVAPKVRKAVRRSVDETIEADVPTKFRQVRDAYNELTLRMAGNYSVEFRAYNNGAAYRFVTNMPDTINIASESVELRMPQGTLAYWPIDRPTDFITPQEAVIECRELSSLDTSIKGYLPIYMQTPSGIRAVVTEAAVEDYTNLFLTGDGSDCLTGEFPAAIKQIEQVGDRSERIIEHHPYITRTVGRRAMPWRLVMIAPDDASLLENYLPWQLSSPSAIDAAWIKPGRVAWEWWSNRNVFGVDFEVGMNYDTMRHYIDFAAENGFEYVLIDEGWTPTSWDITHYKPEINIEELARYAESKGVGLMIWVLWNPLALDIEGTFDVFRDWGVKGVKIDFMNRSDQDMVNFYERVGRAAAERNLLIDFHGAYKPCGLQRKYPNLMTFEGVLGAEYNKFGKGEVSPTHNLILPFTRNLAGPMDYTPGAVRNSLPDYFKISTEHPMSQGTRAHQAALYVVFESPLQMISDSPTLYRQAPDYLALLSKIPTVWDETIGIDAAIGEYLLMARRSGDTWYVAAMTDWTARDMQLALDFLSEGSWQMDVFADGVNAHREATDTQAYSTTVNAGDKIDLHLAPGGGWVAILKPINK